MLDFIDTKTVFVIFHLLGVILGAGGAFMTDIIFFSSIKDKRLDKKELGFMSIGSRVVWVGIFIIVISGILLFLIDPDRLIQSTKFQAKMTIVLILIVNGILFHKVHMPFLKNQIDQDLPSSKLFIRKSFGLFASGAISVVSWLFVLVLGALKTIPYSYLSIISVYLAVVFIAVSFSFIARKIFIEII